MRLYRRVRVAHDTERPGGFVTKICHCPSLSFSHIRFARVSWYTYSGCESLLGMAIWGPSGKTDPAIYKWSTTIALFSSAFYYIYASHWVLLLLDFDLSASSGRSFSPLLPHPYSTISMRGWWRMISLRSCIDTFVDKVLCSLLMVRALLSIALYGIWRSIKRWEILRLGAFFFPTIDLFVELRELTRGKRKMEIGRILDKFFRRVFSWEHTYFVNR